MQRYVLGVELCYVVIELDGKTDMRGILGVLLGLVALLMTCVGGQSSGESGVLGIVLFIVAVLLMASQATANRKADSDRIIEAIRESKHP